MKESKDSLLTAARLVIEEAGRLGASDCEIAIAAGQSTDVGVRLGDVEKLEGANSRGLTFQAFVGHRSASNHTSDFRKTALAAMVAETIAMAKASEEDPFAGLPEKEHLATAVPELGLLDPAVAAVSPERKIEMALAAEKAARDADTRISNSQGAKYSDRSGITVYANSLGFVGSYSGSMCSIYAGVVASQDGQMQVGGWGAASRSLSGLETPQSVGQEAARRALRMLGAKKVKSQVVPVVFDPQMAASLLGHFVGAAVGSHVYRNSSFLAGKLGEMVARDTITIIDDPLMIGALGSRPFDGEGLPMRKRTIVEKGKLATYLLNSYAARKLSTVPNCGGTGNLYLEPGCQSPEEIIASVENGLYLTSVSGPGFNMVTGDYSLGASGIWIENGELAFPVEGITIASNLLAMFANIDAVGNDLVFRSSTVSPTIKIASMTVAGE